MCSCCFNSRCPPSGLNEAIPCSKPIKADDFALLGAYTYLREMGAAAIEFTYRSDPDYIPLTPQPAANAFEHLLASRSDSKHLPSPKTESECRDGKQRLFNQVIAWLRNVRRLGFKRDEVSTQGKALVDALVNVRSQLCSSALYVLRLVIKLASPSRLVVQSLVRCTAYGTLAAICAMTCERPELLCTCRCSSRSPSRCGSR